MLATSVKAPQLGPDAHLLPQGAREHASLHRSVEAPETAAGVRAAPGLPAPRDEDAVTGGEADELALRRAPAAAGAAPQRGGYESSSSATGSTAGTDSTSTTSTSTSASVSSAPTSATTTSSSASSASGGAPAT
jgi:hypothetical protein